MQSLLSSGGARMLNTYADARITDGPAPRMNSMVRSSIQQGRIVDGA